MEKPGASGSLLGGNQQPPLGAVSQELLLTLFTEILNRLPFMHCMLPPPKKGVTEAEPNKKKPTPKEVGFFFFWWASRESNTAPTDYESAALTKHELEARNFTKNCQTSNLRVCRSLDQT